jgi:two-component system, OmpR family, phosphate regulon sensor histidine kinase PhoR
MERVETIYTPKLSTAIRYGLLFVPILMFVYGLLIEAKYIPSIVAYNQTTVYILTACWLAIGLIGFIFPIKSRLDQFLRIAIYHVLVGAYLIFVSGIFSPITAMWVLVVTASYIYYSLRGLQMSTLFFALLIFIDIALWHGFDPAITLVDLEVLVAVLIASIIIMIIVSSSESIRQTMEKIQDQETLERDQITTIINNMSDAVLSTDSDGVINIFNSSSLSLLDTNENITGLHIDAVIPLSDAEDQAFSIFKSCAQNNKVITRDDLKYSYDDGETIRVEVTCSPIRNSFSKGKSTASNGKDGFIIIMRDITKAKSLEEERDEFISVISHELRTPITIAEGTISNAQVMLGHKDVTNKMLKDSFKMAHDQVLFLANMVNDLSSLSRAERGVGEESEEIDVKELAHKLYDKYLHEAESKGLSLNIDLLPRLGSVHVSRLYLEEILQNFITNALKYTKKGGITIDFKRSGDNILFAVHDTGIGVSKSDQIKIFRKFYRSEDYRTRETSGTGLGLYVAAKLARKLGTTIQVSSRLNHGSTFSFTLPRFEKS